MTMRHKRIHALLLALILDLIFTLGTGGVAFAHGERAQEGFLRMKTAAWQDVRFSSSDVKQGEQLARGQIIGRVGSTGRSTGPHLHYEVLVQGKRVNPQDFLREH